jgi:hypothetical protein
MRAFSAASLAFCATTDALSAEMVGVGEGVGWAVAIATGTCGFFGCTGEPNKSSQPDNATIKQ